jgi:Tol biopolymer transport system component
VKATPGRIAFAGPEGVAAPIQAISPSGGGEATTLLPRAAIVGSLDWSPDASKLAFISSLSILSTAIEIVELATGRTRTILRIAPTRGDPTVRFFHLAWRPRSELLALIRGDGSRAGRPAEIVLVNARTGRVRPTPVARDANRSSRPAWSPDGRRLIYLTGSSSVSSRVARLAVVDVQSGVARRFAPSLIGTDPAWSPDGHSVAIATRDGIVVVDEDGLRPRRLTRAGIRDRWPTWSPDGAFLAFSHESGNCRRPHGGCRVELHVVDPDDPVPTELSRSRTLQTLPVWSPR